MGEQEIMLLNRWLRRAEDEETGLPFLIACLKSKITVSMCRCFNVEQKTPPKRYKSSDSNINFALKPNG